MRARKGGRPKAYAHRFINLKTVEDGKRYSFICAFCNEVKQNGTKKDGGPTPVAKVPRFIAHFLNKCAKCDIKMKKTIAERSQLTVATEWLQRNCPPDPQSSSSSSSVSSSNGTNKRVVNKGSIEKYATKRRNNGSGSASRHESKKAKLKKSEAKSLAEKTFERVNELAAALVQSLGTGTQGGGQLATPTAAMVPPPAPILSIAEKQAKAKQQMKLLQDAAVEYNLSEEEVKVHKARIIEELLA